MPSPRSSLARIAQPDPSRTGGIPLGVVSPFTDTSFKPSSWRPEKWRDADRLHYMSVSSHFPSVKMGRSIGCESTIENDMACLLEVDAGVMSYREQPIGPSWHDGHGWKPGTARDFWVETAAGDVLIEVKEKKELDEFPEVRERLRAMIRSYHVQGVRMIVRTDFSIRSGHRLDNCRILMRAVGGADPALDLAVRDAMRALGSPATVADIRAAVDDDPGTLDAISRIVMAGDAAFDMNNPIDRFAEVSW